MSTQPLSQFAIGVITESEDENSIGEDGSGAGATVPNTPNATAKTVSKTTATRYFLPVSKTTLPNIDTASNHKKPYGTQFHRTQRINNSTKPKGEPPTRYGL
jgi:hypothetical protein